MKTCRKCGEIKAHAEFNNSKLFKDGKYSRCKMCVYSENAQYAKSNRYKINEYRRKWWRQTAESRRAYHNKWAKDHREQRRLALQDWRSRNKEKTREYDRRSHLKYKALGVVSKMKNKWNMEKRRTDPAYQLSHNVSTRIRIALKKNHIPKNFGLWTKMPFSPKELKAHLEKLFTSEMNWENYGDYWHIDHIKPMSSFKYKSVDDVEFQACWSLSNLQPLSIEANLRKSNKLVEYA